MFFSLKQTGHVSNVGRQYSQLGYYPHGMLMPGRSYTATTTDRYKFGFNKGSEGDNEISGEGNSYTTFYRELDIRLGRWWSIDPMDEATPWQTPYNSMNNNPILSNDPEGDIVIAFIAGLIKGAIRPKKDREFGGNRGHESVCEMIRCVQNSLNIIRGLWKSDERKSPIVRLLQVVARFTWELPQTAYGFIWANIHNIGGHVHEVGYAGGVTCLNKPKMGDGKEHMVGNVLVSNKSKGSEYTDSDKPEWNGRQKLSLMFGPAYFIFQILDGIANVNNTTWSNELASNIGKRVRNKYSNKQYAIPGITINMPRGQAARVAKRAYGRENGKYSEGCFSGEKMVDKACFKNF